MKLLQSLVLSPQQRKKLSIKSVLITVITILRQISSNIIHIEYKDILNILQTVSYLRTLTVNQDSSLKLSECCQNFFIRINFSEDLIIPHDVKHISYILLHVMSSWKFSYRQYENIKKLFSGELKIEVVNRQKITKLIKEKETNYISHVLNIMRLYDPILSQFKDFNGDLSIYPKCRLSFLIFYLLKMMIRMCQINISEINKDNINLISQKISQIIKNILNLKEVIFQEIFINELVETFETKGNNKQIWFMFIFEILKNFDFDNIRDKIWDSLFDTVITFISMFFDKKNSKVRQDKSNLKIFTDSDYQPIPVINNFRSPKRKKDFFSPGKDLKANQNQLYKMAMLDSEEKLKSPKIVTRKRQNSYLELFSQDNDQYRFVGSESIFERIFDFIFSVVTGRYKV